MCEFLDEVLAQLFPQLLTPELAASGPGFLVLGCVRDYECAQPLPQTAQCQAAGSGAKKLELSITDDSR